MALPIDFDNLRSDESSERASSVEDYKVTCMEFIKDISSDYLEWVDYYKLPPEEVLMWIFALPFSFFEIQQLTELVGENVSLCGVVQS